MRDLFVRYPYVFVGAAVLVLAVSLWRMLGGGGGAKPDGRWYLDLNTGELFAYRGYELPPIPAPSGGEGVLAHVYACGDCGDPAQRVIVALEKYSPEGKAALTGPVQPPPRTEEMVGRSAPLPSHMLRAGDNPDAPWVSFDSAQGRSLLNRAQQMCPGQRQTCVP